MGAFEKTYTRSAKAGHRFRALLALALLLAGCARADISALRLVGGLDASRKADRQEAVSLTFSRIMDSRDWAIMAEALGAAFNRAGDGGQVNWTNPQTGSSGRIVPLVAARAPGGALCRAFAADARLNGRQRYWTGQACRTPTGQWEILGVSPAPGPRSGQEDTGKG